MAIKNWEKTLEQGSVSRGNKLIVYHNKHKDADAFLKVHSDPDWIAQEGKVVVYFRRNGIPHTEKKFDNYPSAKRYFINWMKTHPGG